MISLPLSSDDHIVLVSDICVMLQEWANFILQLIHEKFKTQRQYNQCSSFLDYIHKFIRISYFGQDIILWTVQSMKEEYKLDFSLLHPFLSVISRCLYELSQSPRAIDDLLEGKTMDYEISLPDMSTNHKQVLECRFVKRNEDRSSDYLGSVTGIFTKDFFKKILRNTRKDISKLELLRIFKMTPQAAEKSSTFRFDKNNFEKYAQAQRQLKHQQHYTRGSHSIYGSGGPKQSQPQSSHRRRSLSSSSIPVGKPPRYLVKSNRV